MKTKNQNREVDIKNLVNSSAYELAAKNNVTEQNTEVSTGFRVLRLFIQHKPCYRHQIRPVSIRRVIHRAFDFCARDWARSTC